MIELKITKPIITLDIEGTGLDTSCDRIVNIAFAKQTPGEEVITKDVICNPEILMSEENIAIHGITNEEATKHPPFRKYAHKIHDFIKGCDLIGYNLANYDIPILWEELYRSEIEWDLTGINVIDAGNIFKKKEERSLSAAVEFYCGKEHLSAHRALGDVTATYEVLEAQLIRYEDVGSMSIAELSAYSNMDKLPRVDLAGKIRINAEGEYVFGLKSKEGVRIKDDPGFANWMMNRDFPINTKIHLDRILRAIHQEKNI